MTGIYNINLYRGDTFNKTFVVNGLDLSVFDECNFTIKSNLDSISPLLTKELYFTATTITLILSSTETKAFKFTEAFYDIEFKNATNTKTLLSGIVNVVKDVTD